MKLDLSSLTNELQSLWYVHVDYGWMFCWYLRDGLAELKEELGDQYNERELLTQIGEALDMRYKTLYNKLLIARKPWGKLAKDLTLDIGHADAVSGLEDEQAIDMLHRAAEQRWTVAELRREVYMSKQIEEVVPTTDFSRASATGEAYAFDVANGDEPPYSAVNDWFYTDPPLGVKPHNYSTPKLNEMRAKLRDALPDFLRPQLRKFEDMVRYHERSGEE